MSCTSGKQVLPGRTSRAKRALTMSLALLALTASLLGATSAFAITRGNVLARAQKWVDSPVRYSQSRRHLGYRTDCSGFVSMCWKTRTSWSTRSFHAVTHRIRATSLRPGDAMLKKGYHIRLFYGWLDEAHTQYVAYESGTGKVAVCRIHSLRDDLDFGYRPVRFDRVAGSPASSNLLQNGSFNTWARDWGNQPEKPVWWETNAAWWEAPPAKHSKKTYRTARNSLKLINASGEQAAFTELSQSASITAGAGYRLSAWAKTPFDPRGLELRLVYVDAAGYPVAETSTAGDVNGIDDSTFKQMTIEATAPADAVRALVSVRLAGGSATDASGTLVPGSSAYLDDVSLVRP